MTSDTNTNAANVGVDFLEPASALFDQWKKLEPELAKESDRGYAILAGAYLDDLLGRVLATYLIDNTDGAADLLSSDNINAPLASFGARIAAAYAVGLLDVPKRDALRRIKNVRNRFAHNLELSFQDAKISKFCGEAYELCLGKAQRPNGREALHLAVAYLGGSLTMHNNVLTEIGVNGGFRCLINLLRTAIGNDKFSEILRRHGAKV